MTKRELKEKAQDELIACMCVAFFHLSDSASDEFRTVMSDQFARVEKLFGYEPYSHVRET